MVTTRKLDVRNLPPLKRHAEILGVLDALEPGEAIALVNDNDSKPLLRQLHEERPGRFEWSVLESGPDRFRLEIGRRSAEGPRAVTEYLEADHRRLDAMVPEVRGLAAAGSFKEAAARFAELRCGLERHIDVEEQILFPAFEQATGMTGGGPTFVMRSEHVEIRRRMDAVVGALTAGDAVALDESMRAFTEALAAHNVKEERVLYPMTDQAAGNERARDDLVKRLQAC